MASRAIALFTGGLDSLLAACVAQTCGIDLQLLHFRTPFTTLTQLAQQGADDLGHSLTIVDAGPLYLQLLSKPRFGRCQGAAPCLDCRQHLFQIAAQAMQQYDAQFIVTGDVLGQRRWGQRRRDLHALAFRAGLEGLIERPLTARRLAPTLPQLRGWIERSKLYDMQGKGRRQQLELARQYELKRIPAPLTHCCLLSQEKVGERLLQATEQTSELTLLDCELMAVGEFRLVATATRMLLSRNAAQAEQLRAIALRHACDQLALLEPVSFPGSLAVLYGKIDSPVIAAAAHAIRQGSRYETLETAEYRLTQGEATRLLQF